MHFFEELQMILTTSITQPTVEVIHHYFCQRKNTI